MSYSALLRHRADVFSASDARDYLGQPEGSLSVKLTAEPCRLSSRAVVRNEGEDLSQTSRDVVHTSFRLFFGPAVSISEGDTIDVKTPDGATLVSRLNVLQVRKVSGGNGAVHHVEADCQEVR